MFLGDEIIAAYSVVFDQKNNLAHISRLTSLLNTNVAGIVHTTIRNICQAFNPDSITIDVDRRWSDGAEFMKEGFCVSSISEPQFYYIDTNSDKWMH